MLPPFKKGVMMSTQQYHYGPLNSSAVLQDEDVEYHCPCCVKTFRSEKQAEAHERSKKHQLVPLAAFFPILVCNLLV